MHQNGAQSRFWWRTADDRLSQRAQPADAGLAAAFAEPAPERRPQHAETAISAWHAVAPHQPRPQRQSRPRRAHRAFLVASLIGAVVFATGTGFGGGVRIVDPLSVQVDSALAAAGFGINEVTLSGNRYATDTEIYAALGLDNAGSLIRYDVNAARQRVEALPWVKTAAIARLLPDRLSVKVEERRPAALWSHAGRTALVDRTGRMLANLTGPASVTLPRVSGAGAPQALDGLLASLDRHSDLLGLLENARRVSERRWTLELKGGVIVHLPADREADALARLSRQDKAGALAAKPNQIIDLRQESVIAIRPVTSRGAAIGAPAAGSPL